MSTDEHIGDQLRWVARVPVRDHGSGTDHEQFRDGQQARLTRTIEAEIIPRLMLSHRPVKASAPSSGADVRRFTEEDVGHFAHLFINGNLETCRGGVDTLRAQGVQLDLIFLDLLPEVARKLGVMWEEDECSFATVTLALSRLQQVVRELGPEFSQNGTAEVVGRGRRTLLAAAPGEQHTFGLHVAEEVFRKEGWDVLCVPNATRTELLSVLRVEPIALLGFSLSTQDLLSDLAHLVEEARGVTVHPHMLVVLGGSLVGVRPEVVSEAGADFCVQDVQEAMALAELHSGKLAP
ncbi:MAG: B12-binding domain-containing protein [Myxococcota bacterium]